MTPMPKLSVVVIMHNMVREAVRTLHTLSIGYQRGVTATDYEVIVIDNASPSPLDSSAVAKCGANFSYHYFSTSSASPVDAVNHGAQLATGENLAIIVDGARMTTPGLIANSIGALQALTNPLVAALAWHLGPNVQKKSMLNGYDQTVEDELLESIDWQNDGYRLFEISTIAPSSNAGFMNGMPAEASWLALPRSTFLEMGGFDIRFQSPGGGLVNHHFLKRALQRPLVNPVVLLGEGTFHQFHGGIATNAPPDKRPDKMFADEYLEIAGEKFQRETPPIIHYFGMMPPQARRYLGTCRD